MALEGGGGSSHHVVLLWTVPHFLIAVVLAEISERRRVGTIAIGDVTAILVISNLLVMNQYYAQAIRFGSGQLWTDAIYSLADFLRDNRVERVVVTDWGISSGLLLLSGGKIHQQETASILKESQLSETEKSQLYDLLSDDRAVFVSHTSEQECFKGVNSALDRLVQAKGYTRIILQTIRDRTGRGMFKVCRFRLT